ALFTNIEVGHWLILRKVHKALTASVADASICSRRVSDTGPPCGPPVLISQAAPFFGMAYVTRLPISPGRPRDDFRVHPPLLIYVYGGQRRIPVQMSKQ